MKNRLDPERDELSMLESLEELEVNQNDDGFSSDDYDELMVNWPDELTGKAREHWQQKSHKAKRIMRTMNKRGKRKGGDEE